MTRVKEYKYLLLSLAFAIFLRFSYQLPAIFVDDSVKYYVPPNIISQHAIDWILSGLNFSLLSKLLNYFIESFSSGSVHGLIFFEKILGILSTLIFYLIVHKLTKRHLLSFIATLIFTINPLMLFFEQVIMPEALFVFLGLFTVFCFLYIFSEKYLLWSSCFGLSLGLLTLTKESGNYFSKLVIIAFLGIFLFEFLRSQIMNKKTKTKAKIEKKFLWVALITMFSVQLVRLPMKVYNQGRFNDFSVSRFHTKGTVLWSITEEMLLKNPPQKHKFITLYLLQGAKRYRQKFNVDLNKPNRLAFENSIVDLTVAGRVGNLRNPFTGRTLSSKEFSDTAFAYWLELCLNNPSLYIENFLYNAKLLLFRENYYFKPYRKSSRQGTEYEAVPFTMIPFSLKEKVDPVIEKYPVISTENMTEFKLYKDSTKTQEFKNIIPVMINRNTNQAFLVPEKGLALWLEKSFQHFPFMYILLPLFLVALVFFLKESVFRKNLETFITGLFLSASSLFFMLLPLAVHGEARYRLQFFHLMLIFVVYVFNRLQSSTIQKK